MNKIIAGIISFNGKEFLPACINSCRLADLEIIVIDNCSKDGSLDYLSSQDDIKLKKILLILVLQRRQIKF